VNEVDCNALMLLSNFHMDYLHNLALGFGRRGDISGRGTGRRVRVLGCFGTILNVLELEAKGGGRTIWVEPMQIALQNLSEV